MNSKGKFFSVKNGIEYYFNYNYNQEFHTGVESYVYLFEILEEGFESEKEFIAMIRIMENTQDLKVIDLFPPDHYRGKGISIALILKAKELFNKRIISSSNLKESFRGEMRWDNATEKVWKRLVSQGLAKYDIENDYYYTL